jgi:uncharacterized protein (TIGR00255 family)
VKRAQVVSMTGFGRAAGELSLRWSATVILRSVNHRYLDIQVRTNLRDDVPEIEAAMRAVLAPRLERGKVTVNVHLVRLVAEPVTVLVDAGAISSVLQQLESVELPHGVKQALGLGDVLGIPGLVSVSSTLSFFDQQALGALCALASQALDQLCSMRLEEGRRLVSQIHEEIVRVGAFVDWFEPQAPAFRQQIFERLKQRMDEMLASSNGVDPERLTCEAALLADRADVAEELVRLRAHLASFGDRLGAGGPVGRPLDFICQEIHRELNTLGAKCRELGVSDRLVDAKTAAERAREQVQNLE